MKKAIVVLCVLALLALLAVPVLAGALSTGSDLNRQMSPLRGGFRGAEVESPAQIARGAWRAPSA